MPKKPSSIALLILVFLSTGCDIQVQRLTVPTGTPLLLTSTSAVTPTDVPAETPSSPPPQPVAPSAIPVEGITSTQINVRAEPSTAGNVLGMIPANTKVEITGKDPGESWWQINYPHAQAVDGKGWVTAQYITTATRPEVPVIGGNQTDPNDGNAAVIQQQVNVRSGPGTGFNSLGTLNAQDVVRLTGKDPNGGWLQIDFTAGPEGKGWVNAAFVQTQGVDELPIITEAGLVVGTGTSTVVPSTPTATMMPAWADGDSLAAPIVSVIFEPPGTQALIYNGDISSSQGDSEDWIAFKPYSQFVFMSLECHGNGSIKIEMTENSLPISTSIGCGDQVRRTPVKAGSNYLLHLAALPSTEGLQYTSYILTVKTDP